MRTRCTYVQFDFGLVRLALLLEPHTLTLISREPAYSELYPHLLVSRTLLLPPCPSRSSVSGATSTIHDIEWEKKFNSSWSSSSSSCCSDSTVARTNVLSTIPRIFVIRRSVSNRIPFFTPLVHSMYYS